MPTYYGTSEVAFGVTMAGHGSGSAQTAAYTQTTAPVSYNDSYGPYTTSTTVGPYSAAGVGVANATSPPLHAASAPANQSTSVGPFTETTNPISISAGDSTEETTVVTNWP